MFHPLLTSSQGEPAVPRDQGASLLRGELPRLRGARRAVR
jgi:hypothetical protein